MASDAAPPLNVVLMGSPGAGKGTQAERFARDLGVPKVSTGEILRDAVKNRTELGLRAQTIMEAGGLVGDDVMIGVVRERLEQPDARQGFVLDGFPRTVMQAGVLDQMIAGRGPLLVVAIDVPEQELVRRLSSRLESEHRVDDHEDIVRERLKIYHRATKPLLDYYRVRPTFRTINGMQSVDAVSAALHDAVQSAAAAARSNGAGV